MPKTLKNVSLELSGNAPFIVFDDAELDKTVEGALASKFHNTGQTCVCANRPIRLYVQDGVYNRLIEKLSQSVSELIVGDELQSDFAIGPLAPLFRFSNKSDVIKQANDTKFVLATYFYTRYLSRALRVGEALEYSIVGINTGIISN